MWNLNGEDIQRAKDELKGRRAAIQARYEGELKQLETDIADLETFERFAVKFVSDFKPEAPSPAAPHPMSDDVVAEIVAQVTADPRDTVPAATPEAAAAESAAAELGAVADAAADPAPEAAGGQKTSSRWRMRLNAGEVSA